MNKTELKNFAVNARRELLKQVSLRANLFGITEKTGLTIEEQFGQLIINGTSYPTYMKSAFRSLQKQLESKGYEQVLEEVAYTWFNRIIAIRYMEVHDYLPERVNVLSSSTGRIDPDILTEYETMELPLDKTKVKELMVTGDTEGAFRLLFIAQCNALNKILPFMFEEIQDYTELLLPDYLLDKETSINILVKNEKLTESFKEVEVIGWMYQFYNTEPKDIVFANLKKNKKIEKYDIPAATQLFTPKWIVKYMVENSLGQLWLEATPNSPLKKKMKHYIEPAEQDKDAKNKLEEICYKSVNLEEITIIDPCVGSGHMLVYAFELLYDMYEEVGYPSKDIPKLILEKNLYGLDIDDRAAQLASFALIMCARERSRSLFKNQIHLNIISISESNVIGIENVSKLISKNGQEYQEVSNVLTTLKNAKSIGSLIKTQNFNYEKYLTNISELENTQLSLEDFENFDQIELIQKLLKQAKILSNLYDVVITNPPYMGLKGMNDDLRSYVTKYYSESKSDLFSAFIERAYSFTKNHAFFTLITQPSWLFLSSYEQLRYNIINRSQISSLLHMGRGIFGIDFGSVAFNLRKVINSEYNGNYYRLHGKTFQYIQPLDIEKIFLESKNTTSIKVDFATYDTDSIIPFNENGQQILHINTSKEFTKIPGSPIAYWVSKNIMTAFSKNKNIGESSFVKKGMFTGNNEKYIRFWFEIDLSRIGFNKASLEEAFNSERKWFPTKKGGGYRKWYGNDTEVVAMNKSSYKEIEAANGHRSPNLYFKPSISWNSVSSGNFSCRYSDFGFINNTASMALFYKEIDLHLILSLLNSKLITPLLNELSPTLNYTAGDLERIPLANISENNIEVIKSYALKNIEISKIDWNMFEISKDFEKHPLLKFNAENLQLAFKEWQQFTESQFNQLKANEEELNRIFIDIYNLQDELTHNVEDRDIMIRKADLARDVRSFLSYFIGNLVGRYSFEVEGLAFAGDEWDDSKYESFVPNKYGLVQFTNVEYFEHDIIARLREFLRIAFSPETEDENIQWLAKALEMKKDEDAEARLRRYFIDEFFADHCKTYQKRPIYWLLDSGKQKGLRTLIYMHRYQPDTMATIRFEHLQEIQAKYNHEVNAIDMRLVNPDLSATEKRNLDKRKTVFKKRLEELLEFDKKLAEYANAENPIDLDDGVVKNYSMFDGVLGKIK